MFLFLNRLRGTFSWARVIIAFATGAVSYLLLQNVYLSLIVAIIYFIPLTSGWGSWDCVATDRTAVKPNPYSEGWMGVQQISEFIYSSDKNWLNHCRVALLVDGAFRALWVLLLPNGYLFYPAMASAFLLASEIGYYTTKLFNFKYMSNGWEHQEIWYGLIQDIVILSLLILI